jgi:hypothetical protein
MLLYCFNPDSVENIKMSDLQDHEARNLAFIRDYESQVTPYFADPTYVAEPLKIIFGYGYIEEAPVTIQALYHGVHRAENDPWMLDATPLTSSIIDYARLVGNDFLRTIARQFDKSVEGPRESTMDFIQEDHMTLSAERTRTLYWLGHVISPLFEAGYKRVEIKL